MLPSTNTETHVLISICTPENAYPRLYDAILSTKYFDDESELAYYGYRYYSPELGRWISRDPIGEEGGLSLYGFLENDPVNGHDAYGQTGPVTLVLVGVGVYIVAEQFYFVAQESYALRVQRMALLAEAHSQAAASDQNSGSFGATITRYYGLRLPFRGRQTSRYSTTVYWRCVCRDGKRKLKITFNTDDGNAVVDFVDGQYVCL